MKKRLPSPACTRRRIPTRSPGAGGRWFFLLCAGLLLSSADAAAQAPAAQEEKEDTAARRSAHQADVPLLHHKVPARLNLASARSIRGEQLATLPGNQLKSTLAGRLAGLYASQSDALPGSESYALSLRGQDPLVVIDGVPQTLSLFAFDEIESVTVLKDALATALYGPRASNGVLLVTTRKGVPGKQRISVNAQSGVQQPRRFPAGVSAFDYARLYNEALANEGRAPVYSQADLDAYQNGSDPYGHPDVNWMRDAFKRSTRTDRFTVDFSGGSRIARYFAVGEYLSQGGIFQTGNENKYSTNTGLKSYSVRSNVDIDLDARTTAGLNIMGRVTETNEPGPSAGTVIGNLLRTPNNAYPVFNPDGSPGSAQQFQSNLYTQLNRMGYRKSYERNLLADLHLKRNLDNITNGLWAKALVSFSSALGQNIVRSRTVATYQMSVDGADTTYRKFSADGVQGNTAAVEDQWRQSYAEFSLGYNRQFGKHGLDALVLYSRNPNRVNADLPLVYKGGSGRLAYNYAGKYLAEVVVGYNGANRYPEGYRYRLFPAAGLGWNLHEEAFLQKTSWLNRLKLFATYGKTGNNRNGYYSFNQYYFDGDKVYFGTTPSSYTTMDELTLSNPDLDYEKAHKLNAGVEGAVWNDRLSFTLEYYRNDYSDLLRTRGRSSALIGNAYPLENIGKSRHSGVELTLNWSDSLGAFAYYISANGSIAKNVYLDIDEVYQPHDWMKRTGRPVGQAFGYTAAGLLRHPNDLPSGLAVLDGYSPRPGDVLYKDLDGDGAITQFDEAPIGTTRPLVFFGTTLGATWKGFDLKALLQGAVHRNIVLTGATEWEFQNGGFGQAYAHHLDRWTPENPGAAYPRLTAGTNPNNHIAASSLWYHNGNYARLKFVELGYTFSGSWVKRVRLDAFRLYVSATNAFTLSAYDRVDPEVYGSAYPLQRTLSGGITIKL